MIKYIKKGFFLQGIPARDLTESEWAELPKNLQDAAIVSGVYELPKTKASKDGE